MKTVMLGDVVTFTNGGTPARSKAEFWDGPIPWVTGADITDDGDVSARSFISESAVRSSATNVLPAGTVLLLTRTSVGKVGVLPESMAINQDITAITPSQQIDTRYLVQFLRASKPRLLQHLRGATIKGVTRDDVAALKVALPPLDRQRRIADILDRADAIRVKRREALALLGDITQSIFLDMFGDVRRNPYQWEVVTVGDIAERITDGEHKTPRRVQAGIPLLSARNVRDGWIDFENVDFVDDAEYATLSRRIEPRRGDILISCSGTIGRVARVRERARFAMVRSAALVRPNHRVNSTFIEALLASRDLRATMLTQANSSAQANLFQNQIHRLPAFVPPMARQTGFAARIEQVISHRAAVRAAASADAELLGSLQQRAFAGEL